MSTKIKLGEKSKVNIKWEVLPTDYSHEKEENIIVKFATKYGISKDNIKVTPHFIEKTINGDITSYDNNITENIQDSKFQQQLFKQYLDEREITDYNFDQIIEIDNDINSQINYELYEQHKRYSIKWIKWDNFMSYGANNYFDFTTLQGLVLLSSEPANQGGKTTFCLDLLRFLLFGKVTSRESDWTLSKVFNNHLPEATEVIVEGCICIDGIDYVIKRVVSRPALSKRSDKSKVSQKVYYYKLVNDEYVDLLDEECQEEVSGRETNKSIKEAIGNERDFDLMICVDADNLKGLISLKDTDRGRLISRWIGLLPLEEKDKIAREKYNHEIVPSLTMNKYNKEELKLEVERLTESNKELEKANKKIDKNVSDSNKKLDEYNQTKETLLSSKRDIDENLLKVDVATIENTIAEITEQGKLKRAEKETNQEKYNKIKGVTFDKNEYDKLTNKKLELTVTVTEGRSKYTQLNTDIENLKKGEFCPTCGAKLVGVDNSAKIKEKEDEKQNLTATCLKINEEINNLTEKLTKLDENRENYNEKVRLELLIDKLSVDLENLLSKYRENKQILKDIEDNKAAIANNNQIELSLTNLNATIKAEETYRDGQLDLSRENATTIKNNKTTIDADNKLIKTIETEEVFIKNWKLYLDLIGKNGISKMVLRTVLPLINGELKHLLSDVCDFDVEVTIDNHNDVAFYLVHDGVKSNLSSGSGFEQTVASLALRSVLSKISTFSKPSFVVFDEILGGVAEENYDNVKKLYDKIVDTQGVVLQITHLKNISDWHNKNIIIQKQGNISTIKSC